MPVSQDFMDYVLRIQPKKSKSSTVDSMEKCLRGSLKQGNPKRVKDYLLAARMLWHNFLDCPLDKDLIQDAVRYLRNNGWVVNLQFNDPDRMFIDPQRSNAVVLQSPSDRWVQ